METKRLTPGQFVSKNSVTLLFSILCILAFYFGSVSFNMLLSEIITRLARNSFLVLALLIPITAGLGLNFGIVIGAVAGQIGIFFALVLGAQFGIDGFPLMLLVIALSTPLAIFFGWLVGKLFNSMKGTEMIGGLIAGYFSDGLYQFLFLFAMGFLIPIPESASQFLLPGGQGVSNMINLIGTLANVIDDVSMLAIIDVMLVVTGLGFVIPLVYRLAKHKPIGDAKSILKSAIPVLVFAALWGLSFIPAAYTFLSANRLLLSYVLEWGALIFIAYHVVRLVISLTRGTVEVKAGARKETSVVKRIVYIVAAGLVYGSTWIGFFWEAYQRVRLPVLTFALIAGLCVAVPWFLGTKLGQDMRTVGQNRSVATSSGINVNKVRVIAMIMSTTLACWGQLILLQNVATLNTYGQHRAVGLYSVAALLVGGASVRHARPRHAIIGIILFHALIILTPSAGTAVFGSSMTGEFFREFLQFGVVAVSLALHAWSELKNRKNPVSLR